MKEYFNVILEDDDTPTGGVSFQGETVHDFLMECDLDPNISLEEFNKILVGCGIRPIERGEYYDK